jgi:dTDP-4-dehydrorhamnose 3,5-epimerase-like enzyme
MSEQMQVHIIERKKIEDTRGWFLKVIDGNEPGNPFPCEIYITSAKPGESKGRHYHTKAKEWFTLIKGEAEAIFIDVITGAKTSVLLNGDKPVTIFVPQMIAHSFLNTSPEKDFILIAFTDVKYDNKDTIPFQI